MELFTPRGPLQNLRIDVRMWGIPTRSGCSTGKSGGPCRPTRTIEKPATGLTLVGHGDMGGENLSGRPTVTPGALVAQTQATNSSQGALADALDVEQLIPLRKLVIANH